MIKRNILLFLVTSNVLFACKIYSQNPVTNKMGDYLVKIKEIDSAIYSVKTKAKKQEVVTNFYVDKLVLLQSNNKQIDFYKFGSYTEHQRPHFALIVDNDLTRICFVDCVNVEEGIKTLLACTKVDGIALKELEAFRVKVLKYYINGFPAATSVQ